MTAAGPPASPLDELLRVLGPPLDYLAADDFRRVATTRLPLPAIEARFTEARDGASAAARLLLDELHRLVQQMAAAGAEEAAVLGRRAHALLPRLRTEAPEPPPVGSASPRAQPPPRVVAPAAVRRGEGWDEYRGTVGDVRAALAALDAPAEHVKAVGPKRLADLTKFGLRSVDELLYHLPFRYEDRRTIVPVRALVVGVEQSTIGEVGAVRESLTGRQHRRVLEIVVRDGDGVLLLVFFHGISFFARRFAKGQRVLVHGRVEQSPTGDRLRMLHPDVAALRDDEDPREAARVIPVYEKPTVWPPGVMRRIVHEAVRAYADRVPSVLPPAVAARQRVIELGRALRHVHDPAPEADLEGLNGAASLAHRSLVFDELFFLQLGLALRRQAADRVAGTAFPPSTRLVPGLRQALQFQPTGAQERAFDEIAADLAAPHPMRRMLQGDVGSGKTLVALMAALVAIEAGYQAALMAPTELLAEQHFAAATTLLGPLGVTPVLLTGAVKGRARRDALAALGSGVGQLGVGTHALIQEGVAWQRLGLAVVDEQHRFGVMQRAALQRQTGGALDVLVMSATPIPRTLALTLYGDLSVSVLDELPPGRTPIATSLCRASRRAAMYDEIRRQVAAGRQAYIVYPLVEESEKSTLKAATTMLGELDAGALAGLRLTLVHGRMKPAEKDAVMRAFKAGAFDVLISTTVIEVGIDVPNATVIAIEHADRFGLAQLHQLRGRVGRGRDPGRCFLVVPDWLGPDAYQRLSLLERETDGFKIADADLALRGPGDFLGTRQAGEPAFRVANLIRDAELMRSARDEATQWLATDPGLERPESAAVRAVLEHRWRGRLELARVG
jgi:ATP-dependent DNA helicase RecG